MRSLGFRALLVALLVTASTTQTAHSQLSQASALFLLIEPDSRAAARGNTGVATPTSANAIFWNPAGLATGAQTQLGITHSNWLSGVDADFFYEYLVAKKRFQNGGGIGAHLTYMNYGEMERRSEDGSVVDQFRSYDLAGGLSYAEQITSRLAMASGGRLIYSNLGAGPSESMAHRAVTVGFDLAGLYRSVPFDVQKAPFVFSAGFNLSNVGPGLSYGEDSPAEPLPAGLRLGYALEKDFSDGSSITVTNDVTKLLVDRDSAGTAPFYEALFTSWHRQGHNASDEEVKLGPLDQLTVGVGVEYWHQRLLALRTGYFWEHPDNGGRKMLTFGAGLRYSVVGLDASYLHAVEEQHPLSGTMRFSLLLSFGGDR